MLGNVETNFDYAQKPAQMFGKCDEIGDSNHLLRRESVFRERSKITGLEVIIAVQVHTALCARSISNGKTRQHHHTTSMLCVAGLSCVVELRAPYTQTNADNLHVIHMHAH